MLEEEILEKKDSLTTYAYLLSTYYRNIIELEKIYIEEDEDFISAEAFNLALQSCKKKGLYLEVFSKEGFKTLMKDILTFEDNLELQYDLGKIDGIEEGLEKGLKKGIQKGIQKGKIDSLFSTARNMLKKGIDELTISECTGLTIEEIENL